MADIDAALARKDHEAAQALGLTALSHPELFTTDGRMSVLRKLVHAALGCGRLQDASLYARQLVRMTKSPLNDDIVLEGIVALAQRRVEAAVRLFKNALDGDPVHPLAALGLLQATQLITPSPSGEMLSQIVPALSWNADTHEGCLQALLGLVVRGALHAVVFPRGGRLEGYAAPRSGAVAELTWNGLTLGRAAYDEAGGVGGDAPVFAFAFAIPSALAGRADFQVTVNGVPAVGSPVPAADTRPPRLVASFVRAPAGAGTAMARWLVHARDLAHPRRPVTLDLADRRGWSKRLVFRPAAKDGGAVPSQDVDMPLSDVRSTFSVTGEPAYWECGTVRSEEACSAPHQDVVRQSPRDRTVDIIVPVYGDAEVTRACLAALRDSLTPHPNRAGQGVPTEVVIIADGPADAAVAKLMDEVATQGWATVL
ncbi:hypothetical protein [Azospirillum sp. B4]|uniref:hypothetical protein n=1 Tax=Azospirillum sp. B4 TaxID=95605 RepID=UPI0006798151|nr:hypothetical protein [Azospirillum sp. B4]